ncbi:hypothetical protein PAEPH01_2160 [Pancytospora epiphaga]|nr:hypothetical protein PAEPH01_2160 [Pancytospora epiphaga]
MMLKCSFVGCGKTFSCSSKLESHLNLHFGIKPHTCDICDNSYPSKKSLNTHKKIHEIKEFKCERCNFLFSYHYKLERHLVTCKQSFTCEICGRIFQRKGHYEKHIIKKHPPKINKPIKCEECDATFCSVRSCRTHFRIVHEGFRVHCSGCNRAYSYQSSLNEHYVKCKAYINKIRGDLSTS